MDTPTNFDRQSALRNDVDSLEAMLESPEHCLVPLHRGQVLTSKNAEQASLVLPNMQEGRPLLDAGGELVFLGTLNDRGYFAIDISGIEISKDLHWLTEEWQLQDLRLAANHLPAFDAHLACYARGLLHFHRSTQFCGRCGGDTQARRGGHTRRCMRCDQEHFPRLEPAVQILIEHDGRLLLGRQPSFPRGMYSVLAGFVEPGESLESATKREALEEVGLQIDNIEYYGSQPWPFPASLMLAFTAQASSDELTIDQDELEDARFFTPEELAAPAMGHFYIPPPYSLAGQLIAHALTQRSDQRRKS